MARKNRCIHEIIYDILYSLSNSIGGLVKTRLCSSAGLPLDRCNKLLGLLSSYGLVYSGVIGGRVVYFISDRGYEYLGLLEQLERLLPLRSG